MLDSSIKEFFEHLIITGHTAIADQNLGSMVSFIVE